MLYPRGPLGYQGCSAATQELSLVGPRAAKVKAPPLNNSWCAHTSCVHRLTTRLAPSKGQRQPRGAFKEVTHRDFLWLSPPLPRNHNNPQTVSPLVAWQSTQERGQCLNMIGSPPRHQPTLLYMYLCQFSTLVISCSLLSPVMKHRSACHHSPSCCMALGFLVMENILVWICASFFILAAAGRLVFGCKDVRTTRAHACDKHA